MCQNKSGYGAQKKFRLFTRQKWNYGSNATKHVALLYLNYASQNPCLPYEVAVLIAKRVHNAIVNWRMRSFSAANTTGTSLSRRTRHVLLKFRNNYTGHRLHSTAATLPYNSSASVIVFISCHHPSVEATTPRLDSPIICCSNQARLDKST